jgi:hypothetical protein
MSKPKTKIGEFWRDHVRPQIGNIVDIGLDVVSGDFNDAFDKVKGVITEEVKDKEEAKRILTELESKKQEMEHDWRIRKMEDETNRIRLANEAFSNQLQNDLEVFRQEVSDKGNARQAEIDRIKALGGKRDWLMGTVVLTVMVMMVGVIACLVFVRIPEENQRLADMSFGTVLTMSMAVVGYYVGTSKGSRSKDETIMRAIK